MKNKIAIALIVSALAIFPASSSAKDKSEHGLYRPTLSTFPKKYLREVQLNVTTLNEVIEYVGTPDKTMKVADSDFLTFDLGNKKGGVIEYTFEIKNGVVVNVTYLNSGNFFGVTQRESAQKLQAEKQ